MHIDRWVILISGFTQGDGRPRGLDSLWLRLRHCSISRTEVQILPWRHRWADFAEFVWRMRPPDGRPVDIRVAAYSWGAGYGFLRLARELGRRGLGVRKAVLCDPVHHAWLAPWRAVVSPFITPRIVVPANVEEVWPLRQELNRPRGHAVVAADPAATVVREPRLLLCAHQYADDAAEFHRLALELFCPGPERGRPC